MDTNTNNDAEMVLRQWRTKILNGFLVILTIAAAPAGIMTILSMMRDPERWPWAIFFSAGFAMLTGLAVFRQLNNPIRAWGLLLLGYTVATANLILGGMGSSGPWYMLVLPIISFILIGVRSGIFTTVLSTLLLATYIALFDQEL
ncbi:MAG TPA: hypothetical protein VFY83_12625, partial [Anaerolineales bacterium]|nr:hypothetical protein [Anaerolineales bacterium]